MPDWLLHADRARLSRNTEAGEGCDDGNTESGDGCSANCFNEGPFYDNCNNPCEPELPRVRRGLVLSD